MKRTIVAILATLSLLVSAAEHNSQLATSGRSLDLTAKRIASNFTFDDPEAVYLSAAKIRLIKGDFESTEEFNNRYNQFSRKMAEELDLNRQFAFEIKTYITYDPDAELFSYSSNCEKTQCNIDEVQDSNAAHEGINEAVAKVYGVRPNQISWYKIVALVSSTTIKSTLTTNWTLPIRRNDAKELKNSLTLIAVGRVVKPFGHQAFETTPNTDNHFEGVTWSEISFKFDGFWLINNKTGEVLRKHKL